MAASGVSSTSHSMHSRHAMSHFIPYLCFLPPNNSKTASTTQVPWHVQRRGLLRWEGRILNAAVVSVSSLQVWRGGRGCPGEVGATCQRHCCYGRLFCWAFHAVHSEDAPNAVEAFGCVSFFPAFLSFAGKAFPLRCQRRRRSGMWCSAWTRSSEPSGPRR